MARIYSPSEFLKENKLREIPVDKEVLAKFKQALLNNLPSQPDDDPESNYSNAAKDLLVSLGMDMAALPESQEKIIVGKWE